MNHRDVAVKFEGEVDHFYLDTVGKVTIGIGCQVFDPTRLPMVIRATGMSAPTADALAEYAAVRRMEPAKKASFYRKSTRLYLPVSGIDALFNERLALAKRGLSAKFKLDALPLPAQLALVDMSFNLGSRGLIEKFPKFCNAVVAGDWQTAAAECDRNGIQAERNAWTRAQFLGLI